MGVRKMGRPGEVAFLLALFVLLGTMHGARAYDCDIDNDGIPDHVDPDDDNDGIPDEEDADDDNDGIPDKDKDNDNDGVPDSLQCDNDGDSVPDNDDPDDDGDGLSGTRAQYDDYDYEEDDNDYDVGDDYEDAELEDEDAELEESSGYSEDGYFEGGSSPQMPAQNEEFTTDCDKEKEMENCWIRVDWEPPPRDTWMSCLLGYRVGFRWLEEGLQNWTWMNDEGTYRDLRTDKLFFFEEAEGTNHSLTIRNLDFDKDYEIQIEVFNPYGASGASTRTMKRTPPEPCRDASVPEPDEFVESSENSLSLHLGSWREANCEAIFYMVDQRKRGEEEWSSVSRSAKPGADILISNLSPATWYQIKVTGER